MTDLKAHNTKRCHALWACRSAAFTASEIISEVANQRSNQKNTITLT